MSTIKDKKEKSKEEKIRELEFLFTSFLKKDVKFREDPVYMAIFEAINRLDYGSFLPFDIEKDIRLHNPKVIEILKKDSDSDSVIGKSIGSRLKQLVLRSILKVLNEKPEIRRQKTFAVDEEIKENLKEYIKIIINEKK